MICCVINADHSQEVVFDQTRIGKEIKILFQYGLDHWTPIEMQKCAKGYKKRIGSQDQGVTI